MVLKEKILLVLPELTWLMGIVHRKYTMVMVKVVDVVDIEAEELEE